MEDLTPPTGIKFTGNTPASEGCLRRVEREIHTPLPRELLEFLMNADGGRFNDVVFRDREDRIHGAEFLYSCGEILQESRQERENLRTPPLSGTMAVGILACGDELRIGVDNVNVGKIAVWRHEEGQLCEVAESFREWWSSLADADEVELDISGAEVTIYDQEWLDEVRRAEES